MESPHFYRNWARIHRNREIGKLRAFARQIVHEDAEACLPAAVTNDENGLAVVLGVLGKRREELKGLSL